MLRAVRALIMTDTKTTPAPAALHLEQIGHALYAIEIGRFVPPEPTPEVRTRFAEFLAHLRAADARSARRFEGL